MANINKDGYIKTQDANGNIVTVYPYTKAGNVDGLDVFGASGSNHSTGLVPDPGATAGSTKYLREDGTWAEPSGGGGGSGTVTGIKVGTTAYSPDSSGVVSIPAYPDVSGKIDTAGTGLSKSGTTLNHSNSVTAKTTAGAYKIKYDAQGHITGTSSLSASDIGAAASSHAHSNYVTQAYYTNNKTSGSLDSLSEGRVYCTSGCTGGPISSVAMMVETIVDYNGSYKTQTAMIMSGSFKGCVYSRIYNGSWESWNLESCPAINKSPSGNVSSTSIDLSDIPVGTYLLYVINNEAGTNRYGCSVYTLSKYDSGTLYVCTPVYEKTNAKMSTYSFSSNTMNITFDKSGYKQLRLIYQFK